MPVISFLKNLKNWILGKIRKIGIFWRLFLAFMILISISAGFLTFFSYLKYSEQIHMNLAKQLLLLVQNVSYKMQDTMDEYEELTVTFYDDRAILEAVAYNETVNTENEENDESFLYNTELIENKLYQMKENQKYVKSAQFVTDKRQYCIRDEDGFLRGAMIRNLDSFYESNLYKEAKNSHGYPVWFDGKEQTSLFYRSRRHVYGLADIVTLAVAVYHPENRDFLGILVLNVDLVAFSDALKTFSYEKNGNIFIVGEEGVLLGLNLKIDAPAFPKDIELYRQIVQEDMPVRNMVVEGENLILAYAPVSHSDITATYIARVEELEKSLVEIRNRCLAVWGITVAISWFIAYFVTVSISAPINGLIGTLKSLADGNWNARYQNSGNDEITILGNHYNEMAEKIEELIQTAYISEIKRQQLQLNWKNAELDALMAQINPHFLYNTLDIIRWEAMYEAEGESAVTQMIEKFSRLCRVSMQIGTDTISLNDGLEHAKTYIDVVNLRHADKITLTIHVEVEEEHVYIPRYLIQPIMENAVVHAFVGKSKDAVIILDAYRDKEDLCIDITDNGTGMTNEQLAELRETLYKQENTEESIGLRNVHQRVRLYYGEAYGLFIDSVLGEGSSVKIRLPYRNKSEKMELL